nr:putative reverse transcriptase domain-containing protein [Tanacetum cinerariifolium]
MEWLSNQKDEIICHEKVVMIPLLDNKVLRVLGERPEETMRQLMSAKAKEKKQEEIIVVRDFLKVFLDDLSGLPPIQEIKFRIELTTGAMSVAKSPYRFLLKWRSCWVNTENSIQRFHSTKLVALGSTANLLQIKIEDSNITIEEYTRLEEEKARRRGQVYNWETATYGKIWDDEDVYDLRSVKTEFSAIVLMTS